MTSALLTDRYELTMLQAALRSGAAARRVAFEVFARGLPAGRRYGVIAGTGRLLDHLERFTFDDGALRHLSEERIVDAETCAWLSRYRFRGDIWGYGEGDCFFPGSPVLVVEGTFAEAVVLETLALSVVNHDSAIAAAASRMTAAASGRRTIEMGARRTHEEAAVAAARAAYVAGFDATSDLEAGRRYRIPTAGTAAHAFTLVHDDERAAFSAQLAALGTATTLLVDTYDVAAAVRTAIDVAGPELGAVRIDSGDLAKHARDVRAALDARGATRTRIVVTGDLDEHAIAALAAAPIDAYGVGTALVTGSGAPTAGFVYKLVEVEGRRVEKRSVGKPSRGGRKTAFRRRDARGRAEAEIVVCGRPRPRDGARERPLLVPLVRGGEIVGREPLNAARERHAAARAELPDEALHLSRGDPAIPTVFEDDA